MEMHRYNRGIIVGVSLKKFNGVFVYVDTNGYSKSNRFRQRCFQSIQAAFPDIRFIKISSSYFEKVYQICGCDQVEPRYAALYARGLWVLDHPELNIITMELDIFIFNPVPLRQFVYDIWSGKEPSSLASDSVFILKAGNSPIRKRLRSCLPTTIKGKIMSIAEQSQKPFIIEGQTCLDKIGSYNHFGDVALVSRILGKTFVTHDMGSCDRQAVNLVISSSESGAFLWEKPFSYLYVHPIILSDFLFYLKNENKNIPIIGGD